MAAEQVAQAERPSARSQEEALGQVQPEAAKVSAGDLVGYNADDDVVYDNVHFAVGELRARQNDIREQLPKYDLAALLALEVLALALLWAVSLWRRLLPPDSDVKTKLARVYQLRKAFLSSLESAATLGLVQSKAVEAILAGTGALDATQDLADSCGLYRANAAALANRTSITPELLDEAEPLSVEVRGLLRPGASKKRPATPEETAAALVRDRVWTLLVNRYEFARRAAFVVWGTREADEHVPPLMSRRGTKKPPPAVPPA